MLYVLACVIVECQTHWKALSPSAAGDRGKEVIDGDDVVEAAQVPKLVPKA